MKLLRKLWKDEAGFIISAELVLVATMLVIGMIVGLTVLRNQVVQELGDLGAALGMISQGLVIRSSSCFPGFGMLVSLEPLLSSREW